MFNIRKRECEMKKLLKNAAALMIGASVMFTAVGCTGENNEDVNAVSGNGSIAQTEESSWAESSRAQDSSKSTDKTGSSSEESLSTSEVSEVSDVNVEEVSERYTERDVSGEYDESSVAKITMSGSSAEVSGAEAGAMSITNGVITISSEGTYIFSGDFKGQIIVEADDAEKVQLVLDGVNIYTEDSASIWVKSADKVFITLANGSVNTIETGDSFTLNADEEPDGAIFSKDDLVINGSGSLSVTTGYADGIVSKDDLKICGGNITVTSADDAVRGKDSVRIYDGTLTLKAEAGHGIKATNEEDEGAGYIVIDGGNIVIESTQDGLHAVGDVIVNNGTVKISSGDDGIHAGVSLTVNGGNINIKESYEGLEGYNIIINGGNITVNSSDDGVNAAGGSDTASGYTQDMFRMSSSSGGTLTVNGGVMTIVANGDGLDSNGSIYVNGGEIYVNGPWSGGNGSIDVGDFGCEAVITRGTVVTAGTSDMAVNFGNSSTQVSMLVGLNGNYSAGTEIALKDASGNTVIAYTPSVTFSCVLFSSEDIVMGETYTVYVDGSAYAEIEATSTSVSYGVMSMGGMMGPQGQGGGNGFGGMQGGRR